MRKNGSTWVLFTLVNVYIFVRNQVILALYFKIIHHASD